MISIIIPVYNGQKTIDNTLKSLMNQTFQDIEIIVVNDGSTDDTLSILKTWEEKVRIINKENGGVSSARNRGIGEARGEYLMFVDADDICRKNMVKNIYFAAKKNNVDYVISGFEKKKGDKNIKYLYENKIFENQKQIRLNIEYFIGHGLNSPCSKLYKKKIVEQNQILFDETLPLGEDFNFNLEYLLSVDSASYLYDSSYIYLADNSTATEIYRKDYYENRMRSLEKMDKTLKKHKLINQLHGYLRTKIVFAEIFNLLKKQCPLTKKEKYDIIDKIKRDYISENVQVSGKANLLKWQIFSFTPQMLYCSAYFIQSIVKWLPEDLRGLSI